MLDYHALFSLCNLELTRFICVNSWRLGFCHAEITVAMFRSRQRLCPSLVVQPLLRVSCFANLWGGNFRPSPEIVRIQDKTEQVGWNKP